ncbi:MAG: RibD family protein [Synechococcaceae cyanobacterium]|nr:RibD family protein [Synechococcaceae cyanobacterium]
MPPGAPQRPELRLVLAVSLDGRLAPATGGAAQIGGRGDRRALEEALAWADGALIGAETLRRHGSTCLIHAPDLLTARAVARRPAQPPAIAVSRSAAFPADLPFFRQPLERWLLAPPPEDGSTPAVPPGFSRRLRLRDWSLTLDRLGRLGFRRIALLGGATLAGTLAAEGLIDELQLTLCPCLLGGPHQWLPPTCGGLAGDGGAWSLAEHRPLGGDELLLRYRRRG